MRLPRTILVPTDLSEASLEALLYANEVSRLFDAQVIVLHVVESKATGSPRRPSELREAAVEDRKSIIHLLMEHMIVPQNLRLEIFHGTPVEEILRSIQHFHADLVVMSTHGRSGLRQVLMGSTVEQVVRFSSVPVLTVQADGPDEIAELKEDEIKINLHLN